MTDRAAERLVADNRKARFEYHLFDTFEAGIVLYGTEVKAIREGRINLKDSYGRVENGEIFLHNVHISPYSHRGYAVHEPLRRRKLLLNKAEIRKLIGKLVERGFTLVPVRMYFKNGRVKVAVSVAKGKKTHDKRETIRRRAIAPRLGGRAASLASPASFRSSQPTGRSWRPRYQVRSSAARHAGRCYNHTASAVVSRCSPSGKTVGAEALPRHEDRHDQPECRYPGLRLSTTSRDTDRASPLSRQQRPSGRTGLS